MTAKGGNLSLVITPFDPDYLLYIRPVAPTILEVLQRGLPGRFANWSGCRVFPFARGRATLTTDRFQ